MTAMTTLFSQYDRPVSLIWLVILVLFWAACEASAVVRRRKSISQRQASEEVSPLLDFTSILRPSKPKALETKNEFIATTGILLFEWKFKAFTEALKIAELCQMDMESSFNAVTSLNDTNPLASTEANKLLRCTLHEEMESSSLSGTISEQAVRLCYGNLLLCCDNAHIAAHFKDCIAGWHGWDIGSKLHEHRTARSYIQNRGILLTLMRFAMRIELGIDTMNNALSSELGCPDLYVKLTDYPEYDIPFVGSCPTWLTHQI